MGWTVEAPSCCPRAIVGTEASAPNVAELLAAVLQLTPRGHELAQLSGRVDGNLVGTAVFQSALTSTVEAEGRAYPPARAALSTMVPAEQLVLSARVLD